MFAYRESLESLKQLRASAIIKKKAARLFQRDLRNIITDNFLSISHVKISPDLKTATVYFSFLFDSKARKSFLTIENNKELIKNKLYAAIKNNFQVMPELHLKMDESQSAAARLEKLYNKMNT